MAAQVICDLGEPKSSAAVIPSADPGRDHSPASTPSDRPSPTTPPAKFPPASVRVVGYPRWDQSRPAAHPAVGASHAPAPRQLAPVQLFPTPAAPIPAPRRQPSFQPNPVGELRRCEDLFFAFSFSELVRRSARLIEQNTEFGDAYAYRCFALLAEVQQGIVGEDDYDLVHQLRDYFSACERPLKTEGATVCRLFLKLMFGDLVKKIARAHQGMKFMLEKSDPLCGGAFAVLDGDFGRARRHFDAAVLDPDSRSYALAGIGLLKILNSDLAGAIGAFASAGVVDEDILTLSGLLKY